MDPEMLDQCHGLEQLCEECQEEFGALAGQLRESNQRAERAERERDEARAQAVWAYFQGWCWVALAPGDQILAHGRWFPLEGDEADEFETEAEALAAGRAVPWWTQAEGVPHA